MKIEVNKNYVKFNTNEKVNKKEFKATPLEFTFSKEYENLTCKAIFSKIPKTSDEDVTFYQQAIVDGECFIPYEVLDGEVEGILIGVYGYEVEDNELKVRYSPEPKNLWLLEGSYYEGASTPEEITPSQFEQYTSYLNSQVSLINEKIEELDRINIETERLSDGVRISVTNSDGETTIAEVHDGEKGDRGEQGIPGEPGTTDYEDLTNKPSINGNTLEGDMSLEDIGIGNVFTIKGSVATPNDLPVSGNSIGDVYYVESVMAGYVWIEVDNTERWEELGEPIDLSSYYTKTETDNLLNTKQDVLTAGNNITIQNNVISASGGDEVFVFNYNDSSATIKQTMTEVFAYYNLKGYFPKMIYKEENADYEVHHNYSISSNKTYFGIYGIQPESNFYYGTSRITYVGQIYVSLANGQVSSASYQLSSGVNGGYYRTFRPLTSYNSMSGQAPSSSQMYVNQCYALSVANTEAYTPTANYHPATKKYVDDNVNPTITTDSGTIYTIASLIGNQTYKLGELTSLTITATTTFDRESVIYFTSGSTPTDISIPDSITNLGDAPEMTTASNVNTGTCEASKSYIIAILNNIAVWKAY